MDLKKTFLLIAVFVAMAWVNMPQMGWSQTPQDKAKPWAVWAWGNSGVSKASIHADLLSMKMVGLGGASLMPVRWMDAWLDKKDEHVTLAPKFWELVDYSFQLADSLGIGIGIPNSDAFIAAGGSNLLPEEAMQQVVWTDSIIHGTKILDLKLLRPKSYKEGKLQPVGSDGGYYEDIAAFAILSGADVQNSVTNMNDVVRLSLKDDKVVAARQNGIELKKLPKGTWRLLRMGHTVAVRSNGKQNESNGLEGDRFSSAAAKNYFVSWYEKFLERPYSDVVQYLQIGSKEDGCQNWGLRFAEEFKDRRGYDLIPYLPVMADVKLESIEKYEQVRKDVRQTIHELVNEKYVKTLAELAAEYGLEIPDEDEGLMDVDDPTFETMKQKVDSYFTLGENKLLFRLPDHQTWNKKQRDLVDYVTSCQKWLQQGQPVVDIAVLKNETDTSVMVKPHQPAMPVPMGYKYDYIDTETLLRWNPEAHYKIRKPERQEYRILVVPQQQLSTEVRKKVEQLREAGIVVVDNLSRTSDFSGQGISPDVVLPENIGYAHRKVLEPRARKDIYFLVNQEGEERTVPVTFRTQNVAVRQVVKLSLPAYGSVFVVMTDKDGIKILNPLLGE